MGYTAREDDLTGIYYYRARYYHPRLQRFISEDPAGFLAGDPNLYGYVFNDPVGFVDPLGLEKQRQTGIGISGGPSACGIVPTHPPADVNQNMREAAARWNPWWYKNQVDNYGPWDYKQRATWLIGGRYNPYEQFGNFNYGATAAAFGFPDDVILRMAGLRHWLDHPGQRARNGAPWPWMLQPFGDDPYDAHWIRAGISYYRCMRAAGAI